MSAEELQTVLDFLVSDGPAFGAPLDVVRKQFDGMISAFVPSPSHVIENVSAGGIPAIRSTPEGVEPSRVVLYLHGGGYIIGSALAFLGVAGAFAEAAGARALVVDYRLAPEHPYPAALEDARTAYFSLLEQGVAPGSIALVGDSAGAGLALALIAALKQRGAPLPAAAALISPWIDLEAMGSTIASKAEVDPSLTRDALLGMADAYLQGTSARTPFAAPLHADFRGFPPLFIQVGSREILLDDAVRLASKAAEADVPTLLKVWPGMIHDWTVYAPMLSEGRRAITEAGAFLKSHLAA